MPRRAIIGLIALLAIAATGGVYARNREEWTDVTPEPDNDWWLQPTTEYDYNTPPFTPYEPDYPQYSYDTYQDSYETNWTPTTEGLDMNYKVNEYPKYAVAIREAEKRYDIPTDLLARLLYQESRYRPEVIDGSKRSPVGAIGIAQFMPAAASDMGLMGAGYDHRTNPFKSIDAAAKYLRAMYRMFNDWRHALMAYNWGPGNVQKHLRGDPSKLNIPMETSTYVAQITADVPVA
jgi:soluble lytic murein transglycosylase-like protein